MSKKHTPVKVQSGTRTTQIGEPKESCFLFIRECDLAMNMSYASDTQDDGEGNPVTFFLWVNGDWKVEYKGKEYLISVNDNIPALIDWINKQESL